MDTKEKRQEMTPSLEYLPRILNHLALCLFSSQRKPLLGGLQYCGPHFLAFICYAVKLASTTVNYATTFILGLTSLEESARKQWRSPSKSQKHELLNLMASFLRQDIRGIFTVRKLKQYSSSGISTPKTIDLVASFIKFLIDALEKSSSPSCSWIIVPSEIDILCKRLVFLTVFLRDTLFRCTELEESNNILAEIESIVNEVGIFLYSFFFTTNFITMAKMDLQVSALLSKFEVVEKKIERHCTTVFKQKKFTTLSMSLSCTSIYIVDSLLDDLNRILNHKADLIIEVKDLITTFREELYSSRSILRVLELHQNKELVECEMQLIDLAYQAEYIFVCFAAGEVPVWYLAFRLLNFIKKSSSIQASLTKMKLYSGIHVANSSHQVSSSQDATKSITGVDDIIVGLQEMIKQIACQLFGGPNNLQIISIVGMGGLGKTTLARKLYNHPSALLRFDRRSWCVVSQTYQKRKLLIDILGSISDLNNDTILNMDDHELADRVHKRLKGTRYLLVVDDIWNNEIWDDLRRYFPNDKNGSRILFTSRNKDIAFDSIINELHLLSTNESWDLLQKKVFRDAHCPPKLQDVGRKIATNCKGLPLAIVGIAAVLANMEKKESLWQEVATSLTSYISKNQDILELSYEHLPSRLKPCFLYLSIFKEDEEIEVKKLLSLWVSQGFAQKNDRKSSEDVAEDYLLELINWSMVQVAQRKFDKVKSFTIHDLMRDMCLRLAKKENFFKAINDFGEFSTQKKCHHICINTDSYDFASRPIGLQIRSLSGNFSDLSFITSSMKRLRVLKLSKPDIVYDGKALELLIQLRHVECGGCLRNFNNHMNLEFLSMGDSLEREIQLNIPRLRDLHFHFHFVPLNWISVTESLQTLSGIIIHAVEDEERLSLFANLRRLKCKYARSWKGSPDLSSLSQLVSLSIKGTGFPKFKEINLPVNIKKLSLWKMGLTCMMVSRIGTLPNLEILSLNDTDFEGFEWHTNDDEFQRLKFLKLNWLWLKEWNISYDHFPVLEQLVLRCCSLKLLPPDLGYIPTLQRIEMNSTGESVKNSAKDIEKEQKEGGNEQFAVVMTN